MTLPEAFWVPPSACRPREPKFVCRVPLSDGTTCGTPFYEGEDRAFERHVVQCAESHSEDAHNVSLRTRLPGLYGDGVERPVAGDPEYEQWVRRNGRVK